MKILAIDSSGLVASVAVIEDNRMLAEYSINYKKTHSQTLVPMLDEIKKMIDLELNSLDAIAVAKGPGSFTGLRIGSATAKGLGLALNIPIIPVPTVDALSFNVWGFSGYICPLMDARRNQVYTGIYHFENGVHCVDVEQCAISIDELILKINKLDKSVIFLGDGVDVYADVIASKVAVGYQFAPAHLSVQHAGSLGTLAKELFERGVVESAAKHQPDYLRLSQAERERLEKMKC